MRTGAGVAGSERHGDRVGRGDREAARPDRVGRAAVTITGWNLVSRITGFVRVVATGAALGFLGLGDAYQGANVVSNISFELLAGGLLFSVLVPTFVGLVDRGERDEASRLAGGLLARGLVILGVVAVVGALAGPWVMRGLTAGGGDGGLRDDQVRLGAFLLWFFMPQVLLYAVGAVATALLQADRRFTAAAVAPVANNLVVTALMVAFAAVHEGGLDLSTGERLLLGGGTLAGTVAMTLVPLAAVRRAGFDLWPRWSGAERTGLVGLARRGLWGAGHVGVNQVLIGATYVFAGRVVGGVLAYQIAFTFFLLPHAVLAHPIFTALFPKLSTHAQRGELDRFADDVGSGIRSMALLLVPASGLLAVLALPVLSVVEVGRFDASGTQLTASVLAAYAVGLVGYSAFFLLTRASYALDDVRSPTWVNLGVGVAAVTGMAASGLVTDGDARVVALGLVHAVAVSAGAVALFLRVRRLAGQPIRVAPALLRAAAGTAVAVGAAALVSHAIGWSGRGAAIGSLLTAGTVGTLCYAAVLAATRSPELHGARAAIARRLRRGAP